MLPEQQQRIMGYFIEEAKDHLNTIEQGLINLQGTIEDSEMVHEVFRAAHSVKGGAAMLGLSSIQHTAHRLEDYFKVLKECPSVKTTRKLETLFLRVFDTLQALIEQLQGPFGLTEDKSAELMAAVEPVFAELSQSLSLIVSQSGAKLPDDVELAAPVPTSAPATALPAQPAVAQEESAIQLIFQSDVPALLRQMLQLFKQPDTPDTRSQLQAICASLAQPGEQLDLSSWCELIETVKQSVAYAENTYRTLAPVVIKEVKQAQDLVLVGRSIEITPSQNLLDLLPPQANEEEIEADLSAWFGSSEDDATITDASLLELNAADFAVPSAAAGRVEGETAPSLEETNPQFGAAADFHLYQDDLLSDLFASDAESARDSASTVDEVDFSLLEVDEPEVAVQQSGPTVGSAELTSLADLFETDFARESADPNADWTEESDESLNSSLREVDSGVELADFPNSGVSQSRRVDQERDESLAFEESDEDLSDLLQEAQAFSSEHSTVEAFSDPDSGSEADLFESLGNSGDWTGLAAPQEEPGSLLENDLDLIFEEQTASQADTHQTEVEAAFLESVFGELDRSDEAEPQFFELFEFEPSNEAEALAEPTDGNSSFGNGMEDDIGDDFESLFGMDEGLEGAESAGNLASDLAGSFAFDPVEPALIEPVTENQVAADEFADLFGEDPLLQSEETPFGFEVEADLWSESAAPAETADLPDFAWNLDASAETHYSPMTEPTYIEQTEHETIIEDRDAAALLQSGSVPSELASSELASSELASSELASSEELSAVFPEFSEAFEPEAFSLEEDLGFDLSETEPLAAAEAAEILDEQPAQFSQETAFDNSSLNLFEGDLEQAGVADAIESDFTDLEALLTQETFLSDWNESETADADELLFISSDEITRSDIIHSDIIHSDIISELSDELLEDGFGVDVLADEEEDEFADLEAMLNEDLELPSRSTAIVPADSPDPAEAVNLESADEFADEFADLEALLQDTPPTSPPEVDAVPVTSLSIAPVEDEFDDLEALIKDVDQVLGVGSSPVRKTAATAARRGLRRNLLNEQMMRVSVKHLDNLNNLVGEMVVNRNSLEQAQERLRQFLDNLLYQVQQLSDVGQRMRDLYERSLLERSLLSSRRGYLGTGIGSSSSQTSHAIGVSFDALEIDQFTAFHTLSQEMIELIVRVRESASDIDFVVEESDQVTRNFRQITTQVQEGLTRSRMVPFAQTADRLPRGVRDNSLKYGKQADLVMEGRETLIDKMIVDQLSDPMTHLVNNAVAHGIETPEERIAAGKSPTGRITIRAFHQGNQTIISVSDDGAGINPERVKAKAIERGLITAAEANQLSRLEVYDLLFHHGFSTVDQADDLRGRGVGLDVVRNNLSDIRGSITIDSAIGKGTTFTIRLPLTLSISKALCCISHRARIAFPMDGVEDMFDVPKDRLQVDEQGQTYVPWRDTVLPLQPLAELLRYGRILGRGSVYGGNQEDDVISIVVLRSGTNLLALQVDQVLGEQEIVIKQLEGPVPKPIGVAGATVLGDGRIMPIADVLELIDLWQGRIRRDPGTNLWEREPEPLPEESTKADPTVLIVDDSITVRELLSMTFNKVGYRVEQARDGQEAWEKLRAGLPCNLIFCDIEMPRMDGLELLSRMQKDPNLCDLPIAMLTSRGADRHKQMAIQLGAKGYFTKPYLEEVLLDAAQRMLRGEVLVTGNPTSAINS